MRILFLDHVGDLGGAELCLLELSARLKDSCEVLLLQPGPLQPLLDERGVTQQLIPAPPQFVAASREGGLSQAAAFGSVFTLAQKVAKAARGFDVIVANSQKAFVVAALAGRLGGAKVVWYLHDILSAEHFSRFNRRLTTYLANHHARGVLANSRASEAAFKAGGGRADVRIVYNGFSAEPFDQISEAEVATLRQDLGLGDGFTVGIFGRLSPWKGQNVFLKALAQTSKIQAIIVGEALFGEEDFATELRTLVADLGLQKRAQFLGFRSDIPALMKACDAVVHASSAPEPFGRVIVEGMLAERAVVAAGAGGVTEILEHEATGLLVPPNDPKALATELRRLQDPDWRTSLARAGREHAQNTFSHEAAVGSLVAALEAWV